MEKIIYKYEQLRNTPSDINEHLPTLKKYAEECDTIVEMGVRNIVSTWAFLSATPKKLISLDLYNPSVYGGNLDEVYDAANEIETDFSFVEGDSLTYNMDECDLLFIDTWHDFLQLKKELNRHHNQVKKYIILHDTTTFGFKDENIYENYNESRVETNLPKGLYSAVDEFLLQNRNWIIWEKKPNNNGLTILKRIDQQDKKSVNNKVVLFSTFCDTKEKVEILEENIKTIKNLGIDVIGISPITLPESTIKLFDYFIFTKDNPVLDWPIKSMITWRDFIDKDKVYRISRTYPDYGFAGLTQVKQLSEFAMNLNYDQFHHMIYDIKIDDNVIEGLKSDKHCSVYSSKRNDVVWLASLHYMIFNRDNLKNFISKITLDNYLSIKSVDAEEWLWKLKDSIPYTTEPIPVEDKIYFYENFDFFNYSPTEKVKFFIEKKYDNLDYIKLFFYDIESEISVKLRLGDTIIKETLQNYSIVDLGFNSTNYQNVVIEIDHVEYDITQKIKEVKHNTLLKHE
jgi:hypothetical protein